MARMNLFHLTSSLCLYTELYAYFFNNQHSHITPLFQHVKSVAPLFSSLSCLPPVWQPQVEKQSNCSKQTSQNIFYSGCLLGKSFLLSDLAIVLLLVQIHGLSVPFEIRVQFQIQPICTSLWAIEHHSRKLNETTELNLTHNLSFQREIRKNGFNAHSDKVIG